jgi:glycosyltransferase involved in cell wall biosynthesis
MFTDHRYPAAGQSGAGMHPRTFPSGSGYHVQDLLARGLAEEGHEVFYHLGQGADCPLPPGVHLVSEHVRDVDIGHALAGPPRFADSMLEFGARHRIPCVLTCHMLRPGISAAPNWLFVSRSLAIAHGFDRVILNGLDPNDYVFSEVKQDYLLFISAMDRAMDKGLGLALALSRREGFRLVVAGTGRTYEAIRDVSDLCEASGVEYLGDVRGRRKAELIAGARAVLFPSRLSEGCSLVLLEAMLSGTPVISSSSGGSVEVVTPETGILCNSHEEWGRALYRLDSISPARCRAIGLEKFHYKRMVKDYLREYRRELETSRA